MSKKNKASATTTSTTLNVWIDSDKGATREDGRGTVTASNKGRFTATVDGQTLKTDTGSTRFFGSKVAAMGAADDFIAELGVQPIVSATPEPEPVPHTLSDGAQNAVGAFLAERSTPEAQQSKTPAPIRAPKPKKVGTIPEGYTEEVWVTMTAGKKAAATRRAKGGLPPARPAKQAPAGYEDTWSLMSAGQKAAVTRRLNGNMPGTGSKTVRKSQAPESYDEATWATLGAGQKAAITRRLRIAAAA